MLLDLPTKDGGRPAVSNDIAYIFARVLAIQSVAVAWRRRGLGNVLPHSPDGAFAIVSDRRSEIAREPGVAQQSGREVVVSLGRRTAAVGAGHVPQDAARLVLAACQARGGPA